MHISKRFVSLGLVSAFLVACAASSTPSVAVAPPPPPMAEVAPVPLAPATPPAPSVPANPNVPFTGTGWAFTCPNSNWVSEETGHDDIFAVINQTEQRKIVFTYGVVPATLDTITFAKTVLSGSTKHKFTVSNIGQPTVNGNQFVFAETTSNEAQINLWMLVKNGKGFVFMCGGVPADDLSAVCGSIAATLKID